MVLVALVRIRQLSAKHKLSATALATFMESPKAYYFRYIKRLEPISKSVGSYDHDKECGILWSEFVDRFYKKVPEVDNTAQMFKDWDERTDGWVPPAFKERLTKAMSSWATTYYQSFSPDDGVRNGSEKLVENDRFLGYLDGLSPDEKTIHECKSTSRAKSVSEQLLKYQTSLQVKLYAVLTGATGAILEFAYKDPPYSIFRAPRYDFTIEDVKGWEQSFNALADYIYSLGEDEKNYLCYADNCSLITKNYVGVCSYQSLCLGLPGAEICFKPKTHRGIAKQVETK